MLRPNIPPFRDTTPRSLCMNTRVQTIQNRFALGFQQIHDSLYPVAPNADFIQGFAKVLQKRVEVRVFESR